MKIKNKQIQKLTTKYNITEWTEWTAAQQVMGWKTKQLHNERNYASLSLRATVYKDPETKAQVQTEQ